jgi:selenocysteine lyase/cysteine desulfurase
MDDADAERGQHQLNGDGLAYQLAGGLRARGLDVFTPVDNQSSIVAFRNPANAATTRAILDSARCRVSVRENGTQIRVSPALFNTRDDVRRFLDVAGNLQKSR